MILIGCYQLRPPSQAADEARAREAETASLRKDLEVARAELKRLRSEATSDLVRINRQQEEIEKLKENEEQMGHQMKVRLEQGRAKTFQD